MEINAVVRPLASAPLALGAKRSEATPQDVQAKAQNAVFDPVVAKQQVQDVQANEKARLDTVLQASKSFQSSFAVSDTTFTIFKDSSGQFVTRFTNLKDGSVTYIPEPDIVRFMESASEMRAALLEVQA